MAPQVSWIGLGNMGRGMCKNLVEKGNLSKPLILFNRSPKRADDLAKQLPQGKATVARSIVAAATEADIIFTCVGDDAALLEVFETLTSEHSSTAGKLFVDCSTVHPDTTIKVDEMVQKTGARFVACPVFGAPAMADAGQLVCVLAGASADVERIKPFTTGVIGRANIDLSPRPPATAATLKLTGNTFIISMITTLAEAHVLAEKTGLGVPALQQFLELLFPGPHVAYSQRMSTGDYYQRAEPLFGIDLARKDAAHALSLAEGSGARLRVVETGKAYMEKVRQERGEKGDVAGIYGVVRDEAGLGYEN